MEGERELSSHGQLSVHGRLVLVILDTLCAGSLEKKPARRSGNKLIS